MDGSDSEAEFQDEEAEEETYHPYLETVSDRPLIVRVSHASQFYAHRASRPQPPKLKLRICLKMRQQEQQELHAKQAQSKRKYKLEDSSSEDDASDDFIAGRSVGGNMRTSRRATKKTKYTVDLENDDDLLMDENEPAKTNSLSTTGQNTSSSTSSINNQGTVEQSHYNVEAPPSGILSSLWYSNESVLHVFVIEKILGWKSRQRTKTKAHVGMDISRIRTAKEDASLSQSDKSSQTGYDATEEEVLLIKWRGRSYMHCSWELPEDLIRLDPTNTAKGKLKRYFQSLEISMGPFWKKVLSDAQTGVEEDYFPPTYVEVERILASDETEMDLNIFAKQRGDNRRLDKEALREKELAETADSEARANCAPAPQCVVKDDAEKTTDNGKQTWDPEDYVRYVVKWKGLPAAEMTWEYWKDIKADFVDEVEDYWLRQRRPTAAETKFKSHPNVREFKKLKESPIFGVSSRERPVIGADYSDETQSEVDENEVSLRLRSYQLEGVNWLLWNWWNGRSCILADEMGLGKTIQTMTFLEQLSRLKSTQVRGPFLVVAPLTLVAQWQGEATAWAPDFNVVVYHGSADARKFIADSEFYYQEPFVSKSDALKYQKNSVTKFHLLITTYEVVMKDINVLSKIRWRALVVDEAHRLKNKKSRLFADLGTVPRDFCLLLTGTPLQNSTEELWALLNFCERASFASKELFTRQFGQLTDAKQVRDLHGILKPYLLRRVKEDVEKSLPPKEETILEVALTPIQKAYYKAIYERNTQFLFKGAKPSNSPSLMNIMMELRKCCNHPFLIRGAEHRILEDAASGTSTIANLNDQLLVPSAEALRHFPEQLVKSSGKMVLIDKLLPKLKEGGHKVLIFSQMVKVLDLLEDLLRLRHYRYERLDGSTHASSRQASVHRFHSKTYDRFVMLLSTRAGGLGLNLTAADTVIIFDSDWNPQNDLQAMARAHRIGQTRAVRVYRLLTAKTYEMHMFHSASMKLGLDRAVLAHQRQHEADANQDGPKQISKSEREIQAREIDALLKKGAYDVFRDDDDEEAKQFMETDIDDLLKTSSRTVTYGKDNNSMSSGLGSFSKASFVATGDGGAEEVDLDDPDFWEKAVGLDAPPNDPAVDNETTMLLAGLESKRSRKQVQVYDPYAAFAERERKKQEKIAAKLKAEKEEKERKKQEEKRKRQEEKDRKLKEKNEAKQVAKEKIAAAEAAAASAATVKAVPQKPIQVQNVRVKAKVQPKEAMKKVWRSEKRKLQRAAEEKMFETVKQVWKAPQRDRLTAFFLRFGFGRFTKVRCAANLLSFPIQDIEVFLRSYVFQVGLQAGVSLLGHFPDNVDSANILLENFRSVEEGQWVCSAICHALKNHHRLKSGQSLLRMPATLTEPAFVSQLKSGAAIRVLQTLAFLTRFNDIFGKTLDSILQEFGAEELGKRGCPKDLNTLDIDMKAQYITIDELCRGLNKRLCVERPNAEWASPCNWWNRSCDIALLVGTFLHGLGNYPTMQQDEALPFSRLLSENAKQNRLSCQSMRIFDAAFSAAREVIDAAFKEAKIKAQSRAAAVVAAEMEATIKAERSPIIIVEHTESGSIAELDDSTVRTGSVATTEAVSSNGNHKSQGSTTNPLDNGKSDVVTLSNLSNGIQKAVSSLSPVTISNGRSPLGLPDAKILNTLLCWLLTALEFGQQGEENVPDHITLLKAVEQQTQTMLEPKLKESIDVIKSEMEPFAAKKNSGIYVSCEDNCMSSTHLNKRIGTIRPHHHAGGVGFDKVTDLELVIHRSGDASKVRCAPGVPLVLTRYGLNALINAEADVVRRVGTVDRSGADNIRSEEGGLDNVWHVRDRARLCIAILSLGTLERKPLQSQSLNEGLRNHLRKYEHSLFKRDEMFLPSKEDGSSEVEFFSVDDFLSNATLNESITASSCVAYVETKLLPQCLRLCLFGTQKPSEIAGEIYQINGCKGDKDVPIHAYGIRGTLSPLPDPEIPLDLHSDEAVVRASRILRRTKMTRALRYVCGGNVPISLLLEFLKGPIMTSPMDGLPVWWCPHIHDLAMIVCVVNHGLFSIFELRNLESRKSFLAVSIFGKEAIAQHVRLVFVEGFEGKKPILSADVVSKLTPAELNQWIQRQSTHFPSEETIEKRIALVASQFTSPHVGVGIDKKMVYYNLPMFDLPTSNWG